jgi:hypothetical protein
MSCTWKAPSRQRRLFVPDKKRLNLRRQLVPGKDAQEQRPRFVPDKGAQEQATKPWLPQLTMARAPETTQRLDYHGEVHLRNGRDGRNQFYLWGAQSEKGWYYCPISSGLQWWLSSEGKTWIKLKHKALSTKHLAVIGGMPMKRERPAQRLSFNLQSFDWSLVLPQW